MYKSIDELVERIDERNSDGKISTLIGVSIDKCFINSVANINGTDLTKYKIIHRDDFAVSLMQVSRDSKIPIARLKDYDQAIMSPAYPIFRVRDTSVILPEYLEMWFMRPEFDREAAFIAVGGVRGSMPWEEFAKMRLPVPSLGKQHQIVRAYQIVADRIAIKRRINDNLEDAATAIYKEAVKAAEENGNESIYGVLSVVNGSPFSSDFFNAEQRGYPLVRIRDLSQCSPNIYTDEIINKMEYVSLGDILIGMDGEFIPHIWYGNTGVLNQRVCKVVPSKSCVHPLFLYLTLKPILAEVQRTQGGTTVIHIGKKDFDKMSCIALSADQHSKFSRLVTPLFERMLNNYREILQLSEMQEAILAKLSH